MTTNEIVAPPGSWLRDDYTTEPQPALIATLWADAMTAGFAAGFERYGFLMDRVEVRPIGGRFYVQLVPLTDPDQVAHRMARLEAEDVLGHLAEACDHWARVASEQWRARRADLGQGLDQLDDRALADRVEEAAATLGQFVEARFADDVVFTLVAEYVFAAREVAGWNEARALAALGPVEATTAVASAVGAVADALRGRPLGERLVSGRPVPTSALLADDRAGDAVAALVLAYGDLPSRPSLVAPTLRESDHMVSELVALHLRSDVTAPSRPRVEDVPPGLRVAGDRARRALAWRESTGNELGLWSGLLRRIALTAGTRLAAGGGLEDPSHALDLRPEELGASLCGADRRAEAADRHRQRIALAAADMPAVLGPPPDGPPPDGHLSPAVARHQARLRWFAEGMHGSPGPAATGTRRIDGVAAAPGRTEGTARVLRTPDDIGVVEPGDVVVCAITTPAWNPVLASAGALVCDSGGVVSHPAILARALGIPAVVGAKVATTVIASGTRIAVDGDAGRVEVLG